MYGTGFLPADEEQLYVTREDDLYLVGTAEVPLAALHMGEILDEAELPARYAGYSSCFRREAGTYGKDLGGMFRVHQFDKVEMFSFTTPESSWDEHEYLVSVEEEIMGNLEIPYRVVNVAAGDLGAPAAKKYDIEGWLPGQGRYRELTSCSNYDGLPGATAGRAHPTDRRFARDRAHAQRHRHRPGPHDDRAAREPSAAGRLGGDALQAASVPAGARRVLLPKQAGLGLGGGARGGPPPGLPRVARDPRDVDRDPVPDGHGGTFRRGAVRDTQQRGH